jgi:hypothetical protein
MTFRMKLMLLMVLLAFAMCHVFAALKVQAALHVERSAPEIVLGRD